MKTILTIDFDIVIGNHLEIYNYNINDPWGELLKEHSLSSFL